MPPTSDRLAAGENPCSVKEISKFFFKRTFSCNRGTAAGRHSVFSGNDIEHGKEVLKINKDMIARKAGKQSPVEKWEVHDDKAQIGLYR